MNLSLRAGFLLGICMWAASCFFPQTIQAEVASVKAMGMGYTGVAYPQDALAGAYNPAGMVWVGDRLDIGITGKRYDGQAFISGSNILNQNEPTNGSFNAFRRKNFGSGDAGFNQTFCYCDVPFSVGVVAYERNFFHPSYDTAFFILGSSKLEFEYADYVLAPVFAVQIGNHSLGVAVNFEYSHLKIRGLEQLASEQISLHPNHMTNQGGDNSWGVTAAVGWQWEVLECLRVGFVYQPQTPVKNFSRYRGFLAERGKLDSPNIIAAGFSVDPFPQMTFAFDIEHKNWHRVRSMGNDGEPALINAILDFQTSDFGKDDGPGFGWKNQTSLRFGLDYRFCCGLTIRAGYRFRNTPVRTSQTFLNMMTMETIRHTATAGISYELGDFELSAYYAHGFQGHVNGIAFDIPTFFGGGQVNLSSHMNAAGISIGWNW